MQKLLLRELFFIEPLLGFQVIRGNLMNDIRFSNVIHLTQDWKQSELESSNTENSSTKNSSTKNSIFEKEKVLAVLEVDKTNIELLYKLDECSERMAALCLVSHKANLPSEFLAIAKKLPIPIIYCNGVSYEDIISHYKFVLDLYKNNRLIDYIQSTNRFFFSMNTKHGAHHLWTYLESSIQRELFLLNHRLEPISFSEIVTQRLLDRNEEWQLLRNSYQAYKEKTLEKFQLEIILDNQKKTWLLIRLTKDMPLGFIGIPLDQGQIEEIDVAHIERVVPVVIAELVKKQEIIETKKIYKQNFLYDLLHNNLEEASDMIIKHGELWGWDLAKPHQLLLIEVYNKQKSRLPKEEIEHIRLLIKNTLAGFFKSAIVEELHGQLVVMFPEGSNDDRKERKEKIKQIAGRIYDNIKKQYEEIGIIIGIGRFYPATEDLCRSYQEAKTALDLSKHMADTRVMHFEDLGVMRLLTNIRSEQLEDFNKEYLQDLIAFDEENQTNLLHTLQVYFSENGNLKVTAQKLFVHTNTLRYRLKKAEEVLGVDLQKPGDFVNLYVATRISDLLTK